LLNLRTISLVVLVVCGSADDDGNIETFAVPGVIGAVIMMMHYVVAIAASSATHNDDE